MSPILTYITNSLFSLVEMSALLQKATDTVNQAILHDRLKEYPLAFEKYRSALEQFLIVMKYEKNPVAKRVMSTKVTMYLDRAEELGAELGGKREPDPQGLTEGAGKESTVGTFEHMIVNKAGVRWDEIAGLHAAKQMLKEAAILPIRFPSLFQGNRKPWSGILLYGPPGTGKSFIAQAVATEAESTFFSVSSSDLISKWQGESERLVKSLFQTARKKKPAIIFIDEIDSICGARSDGENDSTRRVKTEMLVQMQGVGTDNTGLLILAATNTPWFLDPAVRRRFEKRVYIPLPDRAARRELLMIHSGKDGREVLEGNPVVADIVDLTDGYSGSDMSIIVREALMGPVRRCQRAKYFVRTEEGGLAPTDDPTGAQEMSIYDLEDENELEIPQLTADDYTEATLCVSSSVGQADLGRYIEWTEQFGAEGK